jgi:hypothetical protein
MCVTRVGRVLSVNGGKAVVRFFDDNTMGGVDVSMLDAKKDSYVEVFANLALSSLTAREAEKRRRAWLEIRKAAGILR